MRDYSRIASTIWTGDTGKRLRKLGAQTQVIAFYLVTGPSANMIGLYYLPMPTLCHETGVALEGASKALQSLSEAGFARYDEGAEHVFVPEMARFQIGDRLTVADNRHKSVLRTLAGFTKSPFFKAFLERYGECFELLGALDCFEYESPFEAPPKGLQSQEQELEQEQKQAKRAFALPDWVPADAWGAFTEMRAKSRSPLTDRAKTLAVAELGKLRDQGHDPRAVLEQSVLRGWRGLFGVKGGRADSRASNGVAL